MMAATTSPANIAVVGLEPRAGQMFNAQSRDRNPENDPPLLEVLRHEKRSQFSTRIN
jgi:hypothetical protein